MRGFFGIKSWPWAALWHLALTVGLPRVGEAKGVKEIVRAVMCDHLMPLRADLLEHAPEKSEDLVIGVMGHHVVCGGFAVFEILLVVLMGEHRRVVVRAFPVVGVDRG